MTAPWNGIVLRCSRAFAGRLRSGDAELLERFAIGREVEAFELLVERHSALVWGVCRRNVANHADREDVFQATFLALVRQIRSLDRTKPLAPWLHTVALRAARKAALRAAQRRTTPLTDDSADTETAGVGNRELCRAIDEEIDRLPRTLREAVIACCIRGDSRTEAAQALGCTEAAVKSRLERARARLRLALEKRGVELPAALLILFLGSQKASAKLIENAVALPGGSVPSAVAALANTGFSFASFSVLAASIGMLCAAAMVVSTFRPQQSAQAREPVEPAKPAALSDSYGDPLPAGAVRRFGTVRLRQPNAHHVQFTPDGKTLVAGTGREPLGVFEAATGRKLREVGEHSPNNNYGFRITPDGKGVLCLGFNVTLWDLATGELVKRYDIGRCSSAAIAPDGQSFAVLLERRSLFQHVDMATGRVLAEKKLPYEETYESRVEFDGSSSRLALQIQSLRKVKDGQYQIDQQPIQFWNPETNAISDGPVPAEGQIPSCFATIPGAKSLAYAVKKGPIQIWDIEKRKEIRTISPTEKDAQVRKIVVSADGKRIAALTKGTAEVFDFATGKSLFKTDVDPELSQFWILNLSADGKRLAAANSLESLIRIWNVDTGKELLAEAGHRAKPEIELASDGASLVSTVGVETYTWDLKTGKGLRTAKPKPEKSTDPFSWLVKGKLWDIRVDDQKNRVIVQDKSGKEIASAPAPQEYSRGLVISDDGKHLAVSFQDRLKSVLIWTPGERQEPFTLTGHRDVCQHLKFSHDGKTLFAGAGTHNNYDRDMLHLYDVATGKLIRNLKSNGSPGHSLFSKDDRTLITGGLWNDAACKVWDTATGEQRATIIDPSLRLSTETESPPKASASIEGLQLSPDERLLAVMSGIDNQSSIAIWEVGTWKLVKSFPPFRPRSGRATMRFSRDGRSLFVANPDTTVLQWDLSGRFGQSTPGKLSPTRLDELASKLAAHEGYSAIWELIDHPEQTLALFRGPLKPAGKPTAEQAAQLKAWIEGLDSKVFREREEAQRKLQSQGEAALPALEAAAKGNLSAEASQRVEQILVQLRKGQSPHQLRDRRLVAILEAIDDPQAVKLLAEYAEGIETSTLAKEARIALAKRKAQ